MKLKLYRSTQTDGSLSEPSPMFVVAFRGRRDYFEVPLAFAEVGRLEALVTDEYLPSLGSLTALACRIAPTLERRYRSGLPSSRVIAMPPWGHKLDKTDDAIGRAAALVVRATGAVPVIYSYYLAGFLDGLGATTTDTTVFQVHPIAVQVRSAMMTCHPADAVIEPEDDELLSDAHLEAEVDRLRATSRLVVASSCTRSGLLSQGIEPKKVHVVMYGGDRGGLGRVLPPPESSRLQLLFVGQISRRKGVGTLLEALASIAPGRVDLTVVTRDKRIERYDAQIQRLGVRVRTASDAQLRAVFGEHDVLVLPSYIEGAGLVLSEALCAGLSLIGTPDSAAPELVANFGRGLIVEPGQPSALAAAIEALFADLPVIRGERRRTATDNHGTGPTWEGFRAAVRRAVGVELAN